MFPEVKPRGTLRSREKNTLFTAGAVLKSFVIPPDPKIGKKKQKLRNNCLPYAG